MTWSAAAVRNSKFFLACRRRGGCVQRWNRYRLPAGPIRSGTGLDFGPAGLPVDRPIAGRPVVTGRPARVLTLKFCFFHVTIYKTSVGFQEHVPDNIQTAFVSSSQHHISVSGEKSGSRINFRPAGLPVDRSVTGRPAGPVRSDRLRPVPVPVVKNPDRFHLWLRLLIIGGCSKVLMFFPLSAARRLESSQMKNSFQNKKISVYFGI